MTAKNRKLKQGLGASTKASRRLERPGDAEPTFKEGAEREQLHVQQLTILHDITSAITSSLDLRTILKRLLDKIDLLLPYSATTLRLFDKKTGNLKPIACKNIDPQYWKSLLGFGRISEVVKNRAPITSVSVQTDPRVQNPGFFRKYGFVSFLGIPLIARGRVIGIISFYTRKKHEFSAEEVEFLSTIAGQAAIAIYNSQLYAHTKKQKAQHAKLTEAYQEQASQAKAAQRYLSALYTITSTASQSLNLKSVLQKVIKKFTELFGFHYTRIFLLDPTKNQVSMRASFEAHPKIYADNKVYRLGQGIIGTAAQKGTAIIFKNILRDGRYRKLSYSKTTLKAGFGFLAAFPIKTRSKTVGCIVCSGQNPRQLTRDEIRLIKSMTAQIAIAVTNSNLFAETKSKVEELSALYSLAKVINTSFTFQSLLGRVMDEVLAMFKFEAGRVYLYDETTREISVVASKNFPSPRLPQFQGLFAHVVQKKQPFYFENLQKDPMYRKWTKYNIALKAGFRSAFYLPIKAKTKIVGIISFWSRKEHRFLPNEVRLLRSIVDYLGTSVENSLLYEAMKRSHEQLRNLSERLETAREEESARLSRQLHDQLGQRLAGLKMDLAAMTSKLPGDAKITMQTKQRAFDLIDEMVTTVRGMGRQLRPPMIDDLGLTAAIEWQTREFQERSGIQCQLKSNVKNHLPKRLRSLAVFRILQEALSNIQRHSAADRVTAEWKQTPRGLSLTVHDNGRGIAKKALTHNRSLGIIGMRERAVVCGGKLEIFRGPKSGTTVRLSIPARKLEALAR